MKKFALFLALLFAASFAYAESTESLLNIQKPPSYFIRKGRAFTMQGVSADFDTGQQISFTFYTPSNDVTYHLYPDAACTGTSYFAVLEEPTVATTQGTASTAYNRFRPSTRASKIVSSRVGTEGTATKGAYMSVHGVTIDTETMGTNKIGLIDTIEARELILKPNTLYRVQVEARSDNLVGTVRLYWVEE